MWSRIPVTNFLVSAPPSALYLFLTSEDKIPTLTPAYNLPHIMGLILLLDLGRSSTAAKYIP